MKLTIAQAEIALSELAYTFEAKGFDVLWIREEGKDAYFQVELNGCDSVFTIHDFSGTYE